VAKKRVQDTDRARANGCKAFVVGGPDPLDRRARDCASWQVRKSGNEAFSQVVGECALDPAIRVHLLKICKRITDGKTLSLEIDMGKQFPAPFGL
jgi:hypothetical protein